MVEGETKQRKREMTRRNETRRENGVNVWRRGGKGICVNRQRRKRERDSERRGN